MIMNCVKHVQACYWIGRARQEGLLLSEPCLVYWPAEVQLISGFVNILFTQSPKSAMSGTLPDPKIRRQAQTRGPFKLLNHKSWQENFTKKIIPVHSGKMGHAYIFLNRKKLINKKKVFLPWQLLNYLVSCKVAYHQ